VEFEFISTPEYIKEGMKLLFREGKTKVSTIYSCTNDIPDPSQSRDWE
jgi:GTPase